MTKLKETSWICQLRTVGQDHTVQGPLHQAQQDQNAMRREWLSARDRAISSNIAKFQIYKHSLWLSWWWSLSLCISYLKRAQQSGYSPEGISPVRWSPYIYTHMHPEGFFILLVWLYSWRITITSHSCFMPDHELVALQRSSLKQLLHSVIISLCLATACTRRFNLTKLATLTCYMFHGSRHYQIGILPTWDIVYVYGPNLLSYKWHSWRCCHPLCHCCYWCNYFTSFFFFDVLGANMGPTDRVQHMKSTKWYIRWIK